MMIDFASIAARHPRFVQWLLKFDRLKRFLNLTIIEQSASHGRPRPRPFSLKAPYTSWGALTDRAYTGRQLREDPIQRDLPSTSRLTELFERKAEEVPSEDTSLLFATFAQWFTDSFIRTDPNDTRKNTSNHQIDLCQIYGLSEHATRILRSGIGGKLKHQLINGEEFQPQLFLDGTTPGNWKWADTTFKDLYSDQNLQRVFGHLSSDRLSRLFATGLERGNSTIGYVTLNTVFLRAHNRICDHLAKHHGDWDDDRLFETARNILIVLLLKFVLGDYVRQISQFEFPFALDTAIGKRSRWKRSNWIGIEFGLLYRWHQLVPDQVQVGAQSFRLEEFQSNSGIVPKLGVDTILTAMSRQRAPRIGLHNTHQFFTSPWPMKVNGTEMQVSIQEKTILLGRLAKLQPYNAYRTSFGLPPITSFEQLTGDEEDTRALSRLYKSVDDLDWYVGIFAERHKYRAMLGELLTRMVAFDAFTHIFSNPLLAADVFNSETFSPEGFDLLHRIDHFADLVDWVMPGRNDLTISFRHPPQSQ